MICSVSGPPTPHSVCACICAYMAAQEMGWRLQPPFSEPLEEPRAFLGSAWALWLGRPGWSGSPAAPLLACSGLSGVSPAGVRVVILEPQPLRAPVHMCFHPLSLQGPDLPLKMITSTSFFCILINTEEAGAVKLYLGENLRAGLFGVVDSRVEIGKLIYHILFSKAYCCSIISRSSKSNQRYICYSVLAFIAASSLRRAFFSRFKLVKVSFLLAAFLPSITINTHPATVKAIIT